MILLNLERSGRGNGNGKSYGFANGNGKSYGFANGKGYGYGYGYRNGDGAGDGDGMTDAGNNTGERTVITDTLHSATVLTVATQLITYYGGRW